MKFKLYFLSIGLPLNFMFVPISHADERTQMLDLAAGTSFFLADDSEGFQTKKVSADFFPKFEHESHYLGARFSVYDYSLDDWNQDGYKVSFIGRNIDSSLQGWNLETGLFHQNSHTLLTVDGNYRIQVKPKTSTEFFVNRDWVETKPALEEGTHFTFLGAALEQMIGEHVTVIGTAATQVFSDDNRRDHGRLRLIYQPSLDLGLTLQARSRTYHSTADDVQGLYFNPEHYEESMFSLGWRKRFSGWSTGIVAGFGREKVADASRQPTQLFELQVESPKKRNQFLKLNAGYSNSASFYGPDYRYHYVMGEWIIKF